MVDVAIAELVSAEPDEFPPQWASAWGEDHFGRYAEIQVSGVTQRFRWILPGTFWMGSPDSEEGRTNDEARHRVTLSKGFWLGDTTVTQGLYEAVIGTNPSHFADDAQLPVDSVSWNDAMAFCAALNRVVPGLDAGLPSEAQWEYACRAGTETPFAFGTTITPEQVNYDGNHPYGNAKKGLYRRRTVPAGSLPPNAWGLHEMHGNLLEWCCDWYDSYPGDSRDPEGPAEGSDRVLRGGSWFSAAFYARSGQRYTGVPGNRTGPDGFRLAAGGMGQAPRSGMSRGDAERASERRTRGGASGALDRAKQGDLLTSADVSAAVAWLSEVIDGLQNSLTRGSAPGGVQAVVVSQAATFLREVVERLGSRSIPMKAGTAMIRAEHIDSVIVFLRSALASSESGAYFAKLLRVRPFFSALLSGDGNAILREAMRLKQELSDRET